MLSFVAHYNLNNLRRKLPFLHYELDEKNFVYQPKGFEDKNKPDYECFLKKNLYMV